MEQPGKYHVVVFDHWDRYMDDDGPSEPLGIFDTYEEALALAWELVRRSVEHEGFDYDRWLDFGDDASIRCPEGTEHPRFSSSRHAKVLCEVVANGPMRE